VHRQRLQYNVFRPNGGCSVVSRLVQSSAGCSVGEMSAQELGHAEGLDPLAAEDRLHQLVRGEPLLVLGVLYEGVTSRKVMINLNPVLRIRASN